MLRRSTFRSRILVSMCLPIELEFGLSAVYLYELCLVRRCLDDGETIAKKQPLYRAPELTISVRKDAVFRLDFARLPSNWSRVARR